MECDDVGVSYFQGLTIVPDPAVQSLTTEQNLRQGSLMQAITDSNGRLIAVNPAPGTLGSMAHGYLEGPGQVRFDVNLVKRIRIGEGTEFEFRADAIDVLNRPNFANPNTDINSTNFRPHHGNKRRKPNYRAERQVQFLIGYNRRAYHGLGRRTSCVRMRTRRTGDAAGRSDIGDRAGICARPRPPRITGPIASTATPGDPSLNYPFFTTKHFADKQDYVEEEFFVEGLAVEYAGRAEQTATIAPGGPYPYKTRAIVRRPKSAGKIQRNRHSGVD